MPTFRFYHPIQVRYGDLDPQGHVNNAKYLTYFEQGRILYAETLNLWKGGDFRDFGLIMADAHVTFHKSIRYGDPIRVGVRIARLGNKSMSSEYVLLDDRDASNFATGSSVLVAYDYRSSHSVLIPEDWRKAIMLFEGLTDDRP